MADGKYKKRFQLVNTLNVIIFLQKAYSHYVIPIVTNCHVEQKFNSYS